VARGRVLTGVRPLLRAVSWYLSYREIEELFWERLGGGPQPSELLGPGTTSCARSLCRRAFRSWSTASLRARPVRLNAPAPHELLSTDARDWQMISGEARRS
jgi:hypothetical protein